MSLPEAGRDLDSQIPIVDLRGNDLTYRAQEKMIPVGGVGGWDWYGGEWEVWSPLQRLLKRLGFESRYDTYEVLATYKGAWKGTKKVLEQCGEAVVGGMALNLGCGPAAQELEDIFKLTRIEHIVGADVSEEMLKRMRRRIMERYPHMAGKVTLALADLEKPWPEEIGSLDLVVSNTALCWMTPEGRAVAIREMAQRLNPAGRAILGVRTNFWSEGEVSRHIPEELKEIKWRTFLAIFGAGVFTKGIKKMAEEGLINLSLPTEGEIVNLASQNGLTLVPGGRASTFWPDKDGNDCGVALHFVKEG